MGYAARAKERLMAMQRRLQIDGDHDTDRERFRLLYEGFSLGGTLANQEREPKTFDVRRREARLVRALKAISGERPSTESPVVGSGVRRVCSVCEIPILASGDRVRELRRGEIHLLCLQQPDFDLVVKYIERTPWNPTFMDVVEDMADWLASAEKVDATKAAELAETV